MLLAVMVAGTAVFAGGGGEKKTQAGDSAQKQLRIVWWGGDQRHQKTLDVIKLFEAANPDIKIFPEYSGMDGYFDKLNVQLAGGTAPDVIQFGGSFTEYVNKNAFLEIEKYIGNIFDNSHFDMASFSQATFGDHIYGVSVGNNIIALVYNKAMLQRAGAPLPSGLMTWDQFTQYLRSIAPKLPAGVFPMTDNSTNNVTFFTYYMRTNGTPLYRNEKNHANPEDITKWLNLWEGYRAEKLIPDAETTASYADTAIDNSAFVAGKTAVLLLWSNQLVAYQGAMQDEIDFMHLPDIEKNQIDMTPSQFMTIYKKSAHPDEAMRFINFFVNNIEAGKILGNDRGVSASSAVRDAVSSIAAPAEKKIYDYFSVATQHLGVTDANVPNDAEFINTYRLIRQQIMFGELDTQQGGKEIYDLVERMIAKK